MNHHCVKEFVWVIAVILSVVPCGAQLGDEICEVRINTCPENLQGRTLTVPEKATHLSASIKACNRFAVIEGPGLAEAPPTILFVIDHSGSMTGTGYAERDRWGSRYTVTRELLDSLYKMAPLTQVGLIVFREYLWYDKSLSNFYYSQYLNTLDPVRDNQPNQAYLKLLILDQVYQGNKKGIDIIKDALQTDTALVKEDGTPYPHLSLVHKPSYPTRGNTNINVAFLAAQAALKDAIYPAYRQFIIFLSDGEPRGSIQAGLAQNWFVQGEGLPTTFTVYFTDPGEQPAQSILDMTQNIKLNGYSTSNRYSDLWALQTSHTALLNLLLEKVLMTVREITQGVPTGMSVVDSTMRYNSVVFNNSDSSFLFSQRFVLDASTNPLRIEIKYLTTDLQTQIQKDTVHVVDFTIRRQGNSIPPADFGDIEMVCWFERGIDLFYHGDRITEVKQYMDTLEVRVSAGNVPVSQMTVTVSNFTSPTDSLRLDLTNQGSYWSGFFPREISQQSVLSDTKLQHRHEDSIVVTYQNPNNATDNQRISVPFSLSNLITATSAVYFDRNADGFIDSVFIGIEGPFTKEDLLALTRLISLSAERRFDIIGSSMATGGIGLSVKENSTEPSTGVTDKDKVIIGEGPLAPGNWMVRTELTVQDKVAPVIVRARIKAGSGDSLDIEVVFSEQVQAINRDEPFLFRPDRGDQYGMKLRRISQDGSMVTFRVLQISPADVSPQVGDSIWINPSAAVSDLAGNIQQNPANRRALLTAEDRPFAIVPYILNNPMSPGAAPVPAIIRTLPGIKTDDQGGGTVIIVEPKNTFVLATQITATISIYDVVKNPVILDQALVPGPGNKRLFFVWDGTNSNGRKVGTGTYLAVLRVSNGQGATEKTTLRIGVKR